MKENSIEILEALGGHFSEAVSEPATALESIRSELEGRRQLNRYHKVEAIADGGQKNVTLEEDLVTKRKVAVSLLKGEISDEEILRFINEAYLTARLQHSNIVPLYDFGLREENFFFATKLVDGMTFSKYLETDTGLHEKLSHFTKICNGISYAHSLGIVHLDIKPDNVQVTSHGEIIIFDWGLARDLRSDDGLEVFFEEKFAGSPGFTAPEQIKCNNEEIDEQSDIFSLGSILFLTLTGELPWAAKDPQEILKNVLRGDNSILEEKLLAAGAPGSLIPVCLKALSNSKQKRYESAGELKSEVNAYLNGFATQAEDASYFKMLWLLIKRHKLPFSLSVLFLIFTGITLKVYQSRLAEEQQKIEQLNVSKARVLFDRADKLYKNFEIDQALESVSQSLELNSSQGAQALKGKIYLVKEKYAEARNIFSELDPEDTGVDRLKKVTEEFADFEGDKFIKFTTALLKVHMPGIVHFMVKYRYAKLGSVEEKIALAEELIKEYNGEKVIYSLEFEDGELKFKGNPGFGRLIPLIDLPIVKLDISNCITYNIESLNGMVTLKSVNLENTYVSDLSSLEGLTLEYLNIRNSCVIELKLLENTKVKLLDMRGLKVKYLTSLVEMTNIEKIIIDEDRYTSYKDKRELKELKRQNRIVND